MKQKLKFFTRGRESNLVFDWFRAEFHRFHRIFVDIRAEMVVCLKDCTIGISESERRAEQIISTISLLSFVVCYVAVLDCSTKCLFSHFFPFIRQLSRSRTSAYTWNKIISFSFVCCSFRFIFVWMKERHLNRIWNRWIECVDLGHFATIINNTLCVVQCACLMFCFHRRKGRTTSAEPFLYINITSFLLNLQRWPLPFSYALARLFSFSSLQIVVIRERSEEGKSTDFCCRRNIFKLICLGFCEWLAVSVCVC